jgi:hypothetical protein
MFGESVSLLFALATMAVAGNTEVPTLSHSRLAAGQKFEIQTTDHTYRGRLVDRATGQCELAISTDGENFSQPTTVYLLGATSGRQSKQMLVLMHEVKVGLKMELGVGDLEQKNREITSEVKAIRLGG